MAEELHKPVIKKGKFIIHLKTIFQVLILPDSQIIGKINKGTRFLLCAVDIFSKYASVVPSKDKKDVTIKDAFQNILENSTRKPDKMCSEKGSEFYNSSFQKWLRDNDIEMYSIHNEGKFVVAERFIRTLKNESHKHMTTVSKNTYINKSDVLVNEYKKHIIE